MCLTVPLLKKEIEILTMFVNSFKTLHIIEKSNEEQNITLYAGMNCFLQFTNYTHTLSVTALVRFLC
jgi:hypothetical protein